MPRFATSAILICLVATTAAFAQANLPLGGYYRPGRCIPIAIESSKQSIQITASGAIPLNALACERDRVAPFLFLSSSAQSLKAGDREIPIRALGPNEKLVASDSTIDMSFAAQLFPGQTIIPIMLSAMPQTFRAWEALDAIILDRPMDSMLLPQALANGTTVAVRSEHHPDTNWPWKQQGEYWVLKADIAGPVSAIGGEAVYLPMQAWQPQQPAALRRQIVLVGVMISLLMLATLLIRERRLSIAAMLVIGVLCGATIAAWARAQPAARAPVGSIEVSKDGVFQEDMWRYIAAGAKGDDGDLPDEDRPFVFDIEHASLINLRVDCLADGSVRWLINMPPNARLAVLRRRIWYIAVHAPPVPTRESPLYEFARQAYLGRAMRIIGEVPVSVDDGNRIVELWPTVVIGSE